MKASSPALLIETSTERAIVGFVEKDEILYQYELPVGLNNSKYLAPAVEEGLQALGITMKDVAYVAVGIGPGSYTGIRVGAILAKVLAYAADRPLVGICTLHCFIPVSDGPFAVLIDAKISGAYAIRGIKQGENVSYVTDAQVLPLNKMDDILSEKMLVLTPQEKALKENLSPLYPQICWEQAYPNLLQMAHLATVKLNNGAMALEGDLELMYLRRTQAEIEKEIKWQEGQNRESVNGQE
jgi:tRNA threonylcarbamoyladenosine biosynthesis protein TsaB